MKLLHIIAEMNPAMGGVCQAVRTLVAGLTSLEIQNEVVSLDAPDAHFLVDDNFLTHALGPGKGPWFYSPLLLPWLKENMPRFDAVIVHGLWLYHSYAANKALSYLQTANSRATVTSLPKLYVMPHGMLDPYFQRASGRKLKAVRNWFYWKIIENNLINNATLLFTCEEEQLLAQEPFKPYHPKDTVVVGLGVMQPPTYTQAMQAAFLAACPDLEARPYVRFLSRVHEKKGVDLLLKAYSSLLSNPSDSISEEIVSTEPVEVNSTQKPLLIVAGPGLETAYGLVQRETVNKSTALQSHVLFPGMLTGDAKWGAFYGCEAFVLPSHQENFGIAVVEALACGKPVLISNQVNIWREIIDDNGGLVAENTLEGTQQLLRTWQQLPQEKKSLMQQQAHKVFANRFAIESAAQSFLAAVTDSDV